MNTTQNNMVRIVGTCPRGYTGNYRTTSKAVYITVDSVDGESLRASTEWLPRSICSDLTLTERTEDDGCKFLEVSALVPIWWVRKLDTRTAWEVRGERQPPMATKPW